MKKEEWKTFLEKSEAKVREISKQAVVLAKEVKEEAVLGTGYGKLKVSGLNLERKKSKLLNALGEETFKLIKDKKIENPKLNSFYEQINDLNQQLGKVEKDSKECQQKMSAKLKNLPNKLRVKKVD
ncbi:MAG: hypothetical protein ABII74_03320 [Elusimicrobiota bacterium]